MEEFIKQNLGWIIGAVLVVITSLVQELSKSFKPWTIILKAFGKAINQEVLDGQKKLNDRISGLEERMDANEAKDQEVAAIEARRRIIRCGDEIRRKERHSEEYFNDVLNDIKTYKHYCDDHPKFENEKAVISIRIIEQTYEKCIRDNDFL